MTQLTDNVFAVKVPEGAKKVTIKNGSFVKWIIADGQKIAPINEAGSHEFLFCTDGASEEDARKVVDYTDRFIGAPIYRNYEYSEFKPDQNLFLWSWKDSLASLLRSKGCDQTNNYALIKKAPE